LPLKPIHRDSEELLLAHDINRWSITFKQEKVEESLVLGEGTAWDGFQFDDV